MKFTRAIALLFVVFTVAGKTNAFDHERKGFVIGAGAGYVPLMTTSSDEPAADFDDQTGLGVDFLIGYAWNDRDAIFYLANGGVYEETLNVYYLGTLVHRNRISYTQSFSGVVFRHYLSDAAPSVFVTAGIGFQMWIPSEYYCGHRGIGFLVGAGYEFISHIQVSGNYSFGFAESDSGSEYDHSQIVFTVTGVLY